MSVLYHTDKANVVADTLSRMSMGSVFHMMELKGSVLGKFNQAFSLKGDYILTYQGRCNGCKTIHKPPTITR